MNDTMGTSNSLKVTILVGTMTGTAQLVADELQLAFDNADTKVEVIEMDTLDASVFQGQGPFLICTSTYGHGDVPDNAKFLFESLQRDRPNLAGVEYGVIALGDRTHRGTFCFGGKHFDDVLQELGAQRVGEVLQHDASSGTIPEEVALEWAEGWFAELRARCSTTA